MADKHFTRWTRKEFDVVPWREQWGAPVECQGLVLLPLRKMHESGYRLVDAVAIKDGKPLCRVSGCSDVIHLDGIGGGLLGQIDLSAGGWNLDCLPVSGLFHLFGPKCITVKAALSSLEVVRVR